MQSPEELLLRDARISQRSRVESRPCRETMSWVNGGLRQILEVGTGG